MKILVAVVGNPERQRFANLIKEHALPGEVEVLTASSPAEVMQIFRKEHPDLILIEVGELAEVGKELCSRIRASEGQRHTGIIFIASGTKDIDALSVECLESGADDFIRESCTAKELMARVRGVLRLKATTDELRSANHRLKILSMTDELTGLANMRSFNQKFGEMLRRCRRGKSALGVIMLDFDRFKLVNDTTNHLVGSFVIAEVGRLMRQSGVLAATDIAARYGGDEFIIATHASDPKILMETGEALRRLIADYEFCRDSFTVRITASIGVAWVEAGFDGRSDDLIKGADLMLYRSKRLGRDRLSGMLLQYPVSLDSDVNVRLIGESSTEDWQHSKFQKR